MTLNKHLLLTDEQMKKFITEGFLILKTDFSDEFHQKLMSQLNDVYEKEGNPGNNLLPRIPELRMVFDHPVVTGALTSVLGPDYMLHAHRHGHYNASPVAGGWHKDSYWGYSRIRNHHPWWAMIMYFPQDTPVDLGPTSVMPGTQNYETRIFAADQSEGEALASGQAGTFALIHYDIWHRSTPNILDKARYMLKFEFMRTTIPVAPSWDNKEMPWSNPDSFSAPLIEHETLWKDTWHWLSGRSCSLANTGLSNPGQIQELSLKLYDDFEPTALNAAYELSTMGKAGVDALLQALDQDRINVSLLAAYGLSISGQDAIDGLIAALLSEREHAVTHALFALGELGERAAEAVPALTRLRAHSSVLIRRTLTESLGMIGACPSTYVDTIVSNLIGCLQDEDTQIRFMSGLALARMGAAAEAAVLQLEIALDDENRYVRAHAAEALHYIGTERAKDALIKFLLNARWCPTTSPVNAFYP